MTAKEFFEKLNADTLKPSFALKGMVKKSDKADELLFTAHGGAQWLRIPVGMVESVYVLSHVTTGDSAHTLVKLKMKAPTSDEGKMLYELLSQGGHGGGHCQCGCGCQHGGGCHCGCGCQHSGGCHCGSGCSCGGQCKCGCGCGCQCGNKSEAASCCNKG